MIVQNMLQQLHVALLNIDNCRVENWNFKKVISPFTRIYLALDGDATLLHSNTKINVKPGHLYLIPGFTLCNYSSQHFFSLYYLHFIIKLADNISVFDLLSFDFERKATSTDYIIFERLLDINPNKMLNDINPRKYSKDNMQESEKPMNSAEEVACFIETQGLILQLLSRFINLKNENFESHALVNNSKIKSVLSYIHNNIGSKIRIAELSDICSLSEDYFSRLFLKIMGTTPINYINQKRIKTAQFQLLSTNDPIEKIAFDCGIENLSNFNRLFKKYSCLTPGEYRKVHQSI